MTGTAFTGWLTTETGEPLWDGDGEFIWTDPVYADNPTGTAAPVYQLDVCTNFVRVGVCDTFTFAGVTRRNTIGEWQAAIPAGGIEFNGDATIGDVDSIIVWDLSTRPASIVAAGTLTPTGTVDTGITVTSSSAGTLWELSGVDLFGILGQRVAYPDPATEPPWADGYDERTGVASTVAAEYIDANLGSGALTERQVAGVAVVDGVAGAAVTWTARLQPLSTLVTSICNAAGLVCRASMPSPGSIVYTVTTGADRTSQTVISEHDLSGNVTVTTAEARATYVIAGGSGVLTSRTFQTAGTAASGIDRVESFYDVPNLTGGSAVARSAAGALDEAAAETAVAFDTLIPDRWRYQDDYDVGDTITVEVGSVRYSVLVDAVAFTINPDRSVVRPILGRTTNNEAAQIMRTLWNTVTQFAQTIA